MKTSVLRSKSSLLITFTSFNTNAWIACFWCLGFIITNPHLLQRIRDEVSPVITSEASSFEIAGKLRQCACLNSAYLETLRYAAATGSSRQAVAPFNLGGRTIQPDVELVLLYRAILTDREVFGDEAESFVWDRFLKNPELANIPSFRPFGGGVGQCPGRFLAQSEILFLIGLVVQKYDFESLSRIPDMDTKTPSLGMMGPVKGQDLLVRMSLRVVT